MAQIAIPITVVGVMLRSRLARAGVADLVVELGQTPTPARLRDALANALGDPSLQVAWWDSARDTFVDATGRRSSSCRRRQRARPSRRSNGTASLRPRSSTTQRCSTEPGLIASVASAMRLAVENDRLTAEVEAQLQEVRASRARIVEAGDRERRRVERDLHDGAQQRLVSLSLELQVARRAAGRRW